MKQIGFLVNPVAGIGGRVGLKGSDGAEIQKKARSLGAVPEAAVRALHALEKASGLEEKVTFLTAPGIMGEEVLKKTAFSYHVIGTLADGETTAEDTIRIAREILEEGADLLLFAGGDGTARDIYKAVGVEQLCVGIPAGVKIHSPVYAKNPGAAGKLAAMWMSGQLKRCEEKEVLDIDEDAYRSGHISTSLYGYLKVPAEWTLTQNRKAPTPLSDEAAIESIAYEVTDHMEPDVVYLVGAGTTTRGVMEKLGLPNTLIGVDVIENGKVLENDAYGERILSHIRGKRAKLILTVTGGQGFLFGRGNQQLTPAVIRAVGKENLVILATRSKLAELRGNPLQVDTDDAELNKELCGYYKAITGYKEYTVCQVAAL